MRHPFRTDHCGTLDESDASREVRLSGWVVNVRVLGRLAFATLRDSTGLIQIIATDAASRTCLQDIRPGAVATVDGQVVRRRTQDVNPDQPTGSIEVRVTTLRHRSGTLLADSTRTAQLSTGHAESLARIHLHERGFTYVGERDRGPLAQFLPGHDRVFRVRTTAGAADGRRVLEFESVFVTLDDLRTQVQELVGALSPAMPSVSAGSVSEVPATTHTPAAVGPALLVHGLPVAGLPALDGHDRRLTFFAERGDGPLGAGDTAQCLLLLAHDRLVGAGAIRRLNLHDVAHQYFTTRDVDPLLLEEIQDLVRDGSSTSPGEGWFTLDLDRLVEPAVRRDGAAESLTLPEVLPNPRMVARDLTVLLREGDPQRSRPGGGTRAEQTMAARIERWDVEASAAMARSRTAAPSVVLATADGGDPWAEHRNLLDDFSMDQDVCGRLLDVVPGTAAHLARLPAGERFEWVWSVLGSQRVRDLLRHEPSFALARQAASLGVITDARQLSYLDIPALRHLAVVLDRYPHTGAVDGDRRAGVLGPLRQVLAASPGSVTALLAALAEGDDATEKTVTRLVTDGRQDVLTRAAQAWLATPGLLPLALQVAEQPTGIERMGELARRVGSRVLPNLPFDPADVSDPFIEQAAATFPSCTSFGSAADPREMAAGILHHVFRPISLTYTETRTVLEQAGDWHDHVRSSGLTPGGRHWSPDRGCYEFRQVPGPEGLRCYLSKNAPSALAKGSVGICTAHDLELYRRSDHHHLNLVDTATGVVVGNAQLHVLSQGGGRVLLIRAINASNTYLARNSARAPVEAVLIACVELAASSGIDEVHLGEGLSFWHLNSSRPQIRAVLEELYDRLPVVVLDRPVFLFRFGGVDLELAKSYRLWAGDPSVMGGFRLRHFLEAVA